MRVSATLVSSERRLGHGGEEGEALSAYHCGEICGVREG